MDAIKPQLLASRLEVSTMEKLPRQVYTLEFRQQAVAARRPAAGLLHHSDRGSQYCSHEYQALLRGHDMRASMSRKGDCYDNAPVESFFGTLKTELVHHRRDRSRAEAAREIMEYIDLFYNRQRRQARLGYLSPVAYTQLFTRRRAAA
ncbi:MAG: IS3 family transposase [Pyrinomonadaceae bacterium]